MNKASPAYHEELTELTISLAADAQARAKKLACDLKTKRENRNKRVRSDETEMEEGPPSKKTKPSSEEDE